MQTVTRETKFKTTAKKDEIKFKIDDVNPEIIIKIVSDTYPNPRRTVSTEYVQNGADSHRWANKSHIPLDIQLPTKLDPNFVVRDYGIGMSEKDIIDTFAYVFRSTKNENDKDAGGFGIGKLAFGAYTGIMFLDLYSGTEMRKYLVRLKDGYAGCQEQFVEKSDEPKGVKVTIPVMTKDADYFRDVAPFQYGFMSTRPNISEEPDFFEEFDNWMLENVLLRTKDDKEILYTCNLISLPPMIEDHTSSPQALIGGLPFDLNLKTLGQNTKTKADKDALELLKDRFFTLQFGIGEVDVVPSRDNLKYNLKTCRAVLNRLCNLHECVRAHVQTEIKNIPELGKLWDRTKVFIEQGLMTQEDVNALTWKGHVGAVAAFQKLLNDAKNSGNYSTKHIKFTEGSAYVHSNCDRDSFNPDTTDERLQSIEYIWPADSCKILHELEHWMYTHVGYTRMQRIPCRAFVLGKDTIVRCRNIHSCLHTLTFGSERGTLLPNTPAVRIYVADKACGKGNADKLISHWIHNAYYEKNKIKFPFSSSIMLYLDSDISYKDFVDHLVLSELGLKQDMFVDVSKLPKPASLTKIGIGPRIGSKTGTEFSENTMFLFNMLGSSPRDKFNDSFWFSASKVELDALDADDAVELVYVRVKAFQPQRHDPKIDGKIDRRCALEIQPRYGSSAFKDKLRALERTLGAGKKLRLIGVKPKVKMEKLPQIKHMEAMTEQRLKDYFEKIPSVPPKAMTEEFLLTRALNLGLNDYDERFKTPQALKNMKRIPALRELKTIYDNCRKVFVVRSSTLSEKRIHEILGAIAHISDLRVSMHTPYKNRIETYKATTGTVFPRITLKTSVTAGAADYVGSYPYIHKPHSTEHMHRFFWKRFWGEARELPMFKTEEDFTKWVSGFSNNLSKASKSIKHVVDTTNKCWEQLAQRAENGIALADKLFEASDVERFKRKLSALTSSRVFMNHDPHPQSILKYDGTLIGEGGPCNKNELQPLYTFSFLLAVLWVMLEDPFDLADAAHVYTKLQPSTTLYRPESQWSNADWVTGCYYASRWLDLTCIAMLENLKGLPKLDKEKIRLISDFENIKTD